MTRRAGSACRSRPRAARSASSSSRTTTACLSEDDKDLLIFVGQHIATALSRARAIEETRERNAELAVINEIGDALARQLDFQAVIDLVGDKVREIFAVDTMTVVLYDEATGEISFPFVLDEGVKTEAPAIKLGEGLTSKVIRSQGSADLRHGQRGGRGGCDLIRDPDRGLVGRTDPGWRPVVIGIISLESVKPHAFNDSDVRLLSTVASSMGVALENARLFDETKRLLAETDQRAAELAIVNEIGSALAKQLEFEAIIELIGAADLDDVRGPLDVRRPVRRRSAARSPSRSSCKKASRITPSRSSSAPA